MLRRRPRFSSLSSALSVTLPRSIESARYLCRVAEDRMQNEGAKERAREREIVDDAMDAAGSASGGDHIKPSK